MKMYKYLIMGMLLVSAVAVGLSFVVSLEGEAEANHKKHKHSSKKENATTYYTCPMHPEVLTEKSGKCPKCGMKLIKQVAEKEEKKDVTEKDENKITFYTCPMHPEERGVEGGKCSECDMELVKKTAKKQTTCPVMGGAINSEIYADHDGMRVYFCCAGCKPKFESDPAKYIKKLRKDGVEPSPVTNNDK